MKKKTLSRARGELNVISNSKSTNQIEEIIYG